MSTYTKTVKRIYDSEGNLVDETVTEIWENEERYRIGDPIVNPYPVTTPGVMPWWETGPIANADDLQVNS